MNSAAPPDPHRLRAMHRTLRVSRGSFAAEVLIAVAIAATVAIPVIALVIQERQGTEHARMDYLVLVAAREEMYRTRFLVAAGVVGRSLAHDWRALAGGALDVAGPVAAGKLPDLVYTDEQRRIETRLDVRPGARRPLVAVLDARWQMEGAAPDARRSRSVRLTFSLMGPRGGTQ